MVELGISCSPFGTTLDWLSASVMWYDHTFLSRIPSARLNQ